ncbi:pectate lyase [Actinoplanes regularis]|uniref:pectate lyase n=1 Tax=Actinoplanes regularis TaxID=52697 RepID=UPI0024A18A5A|nr:pectate lyase [Actinoplanes regularis]GLW32190.1 hypothetical protein Areg01_51290 [Actinoplanes regularis]
MRHAHAHPDDAMAASRRRRRMITGLGAAGAAGAVTVFVAVLVPTASASTMFSDDFENGATGWSKSGGTWTVVTDGSKVFQQSKAESALSRVFAGETTWSDYSVQARVKGVNLGSSGLAGVAARASSSSTMYRLALLGSGKAELQAVKGSVVSVLGSASISSATAWHTLRIDASGSTIKGFLDGTAIGSATGTLAAQGRIALVTSRASAEFDDVTVNPVSGSTATATVTATATASASASASATPTKTATASATWPTATGSKAVTETIEVSGSLDGGNVRYFGSGDLGTGSQDEDQGPLFELADGASLSNVILGDPAADGVHCLGSCTLTNVWWENVGEDAATFKGGTSAAYTVNGGGAKGADDKVFQHNGGGTLTIKNFQVSDYGKLYRSCGNCKTQFKRTVVLQNVTATGKAKALVGINTNFGDTATLSGITVVGADSLKICVKFKGNNTGAEPTEIGSGADGVNCKFSDSDITFK